MCMWRCACLVVNGCAVASIWWSMGHETFSKRAREKARQEKQAAKRARRHSRSAETSSQPNPNEEALMEEFARLSAQYEAGQIDESNYVQQRRRIFTELGIETD